MENENIKQTQKSLKYVLIGFIVFQIIFLVFINLFLKTFFADMGDDMMSKIAPIAVNVFALIIGLVTDIAFIVKIKRYGELHTLIKICSYRHRKFCLKWVLHNFCYELFLLT